MKKLLMKTDDSDDEEVIDENYDPDAEEPQKETKYH